MAVAGTIVVQTTHHQWTAQSTGRCQRAKFAPVQPVTAKDFWIKIGGRGLITDPTAETQAQETFIIVRGAPLVNADKSAGDEVMSGFFTDLPDDRREQGFGGLQMPRGLIENRCAAIGRTFLDHQVAPVAFDHCRDSDMRRPVSLTAHSLPLPSSRYHPC